MFAPDLIARAREILDLARAQKLRIATAESCTGGLIAALLTEIPGSSDVFERGVVTYSNEAKTDQLGVPARLIEDHGAVSMATAMAMADGALKHSRAQVAVAVTGIAGPGGGGAAKPVGLVYIATARAGAETEGREFHFGDLGRGKIRLASVTEALSLLRARL